MGSKQVSNKQVNKITEKLRQVYDVDAYHKQVNNRQVQDKQLRISYVQVNNTGYFSLHRQ